MSIPLDLLEAEALQLSRRDRAALAHRLIVSLDEDEDDDLDEVELAWEAEIQRRLDEIASGRAKPLSAAEVFAKGRASTDRLPRR